VIPAFPSISRARLLDVRLFVGFSHYSLRQLNTSSIYHFGSNPPVLLLATLEMPYWYYGLLRLIAGPVFFVCWIMICRDENFEIAGLVLGMLLTARFLF
jgi:hypothetical protein